MKKVIQIILVLILFVAITVGVLVGSYVFPTPSQFGESKYIANTVWYSEHDNIELNLTDSGEFEIKELDSKKLLTKGYYKINEDDQKLKIFILPKYKNEDLGFLYKLGYFSTMAYSDLTVDENNEDAPKTCKFSVGRFMDFTDKLDDKNEK